MKKVCVAFVAVACLLSSGLAFADETVYELTIDADGTLMGWTGTLPEELVLPNGVTNIADGVFANCSGLKSVTIPNGVTRIGTTFQGNGVFDRCVNLKRIQIPATVTWIGDETFARCVNLQKVEFLGDEPKVGGWCLFKGASTSAIIEVKKDANWYDPLTCERLQTWFGRTVSYEGERVVSMAAVDAETMKVRINDYVSFLRSIGASLTSDEMAEFVSWGREIVERCPECLSAYQDLLTAIGVSLTADEMASMTSWATSITSKAVSGGGLVVTNVVTSGSSSSSSSSSGTGASSEGGVVAQAVAANLTVTNVVVHYVQEVENVASIATATTDGLVAVVSEVLGSSMMSIPSSWTNSYPQFVEMFGDDFASALMKPSGKVGSDGAALQVWQDYVAGTDPTDPTSRFAATIDFVDGTPVVTWSPNVEDGSRVYRIWGKKSLADADWAQIDAASIASYNFFKVTVEMR